MALPNEILGFAAEIVEHLRQRGETISTAESLTAGAVSSALVTISGASGPNPLDGHPVGAVWVAIEGPVSQTIELSLSGERESVRNAATSSAIATFARILRHRA
jgi:nicotinamide-nucleotide amidase